MRTFIDNVCIQAVEDKMLGELWEIFTPQRVLERGPEMTAQVAEEPAESQSMRTQLTQRLGVLRNGLRVCRRHEKLASECK